MRRFGTHDLGHDVVDGVLVVVHVLHHHALVDDLHQVVVELERSDRMLVTIHIVRRLGEKRRGHHFLGDVGAHLVDADPFVGVPDHQVEQVAVGVEIPFDLGVNLDLLLVQLLLRLDLNVLNQLDFVLQFAERILNM